MMLIGIRTYSSKEDSLKTHKATPIHFNATSIAATSAARWAVLSLALATLLPALGSSIANIALPTLALSFNASFQQVQWVVLAYLLATTCVIVSVGQLADRLGRRRLLLAGLGLFTLASALCYCASSLWYLIAARSLQGGAAAILMALSMALVTEIVPQEKTGSAMGLLATMSAVGTALGPSLGGLLMASFGWRALFFITLPLGLMGLILAYYYLPPDRQHSNTAKTRFDYLGTLLLAVTLAAYALAMTVEHAHFNRLKLALLMLASAAAALFVLAEQRVSSPLIRLSLLRDPCLSAGFVMSGLVTTVVMATLVLGPFYLSGALGLSSIHIGMLMSCGPLIAALTGVPAGRGVDRFGTHTTSMCGLLLMGAGCLGMMLLPGKFGIPAYLLALTLITAGYALFQAANNTAVMRSTSDQQRGLISGMLNLSRYLGLITGASLMGAVFALGAASPNLMTARPEALARGMQFSFAFAALLILSALAIAAASEVLLQGKRASPTQAMPDPNRK